MIAPNILNTLLEVVALQQKRFSLNKGQFTVLQLPEGYKSIRVVSGLAWVSLEDQAVALANGEEHRFSAGIKDAWVSAEGGMPLVFEVSREPSQN